MRPQALLSHTPNLGLPEVRGDRDLAWPSAARLEGVREGLAHGGGALGELVDLPSPPPASVGLPSARRLSPSPPAGGEDTRAEALTGADSPGLVARWEGLPGRRGWGRARKGTGSVSATFPGCARAPSRRSPSLVRRASAKIRLAAPKPGGRWLQPSSFGSSRRGLPCAGRPSLVTRLLRSPAG